MNIQIYKRFSPTVFSAFSIVAMFFIWLAFAPIQAGGNASYIVVIGKSMEPKFHIGDLIIARRESFYQVGDAVVYRNVDLEHFVFHRIMAEKMAHYTLQGDNNEWVDTYQPSKQEILGKLWLHIPRGGVVLQKVRSPFAMAVIAAGLAAVLVSNVVHKKNKGNKNMKSQSLQERFSNIRQKTGIWLADISTSDFKKPSAMDQGGSLEIVFFVLGSVLLASLIIGIISFSRPTSRIAQDDVQYQHLGIFSYLAPAPQGVYDSNTISSGDPIFPLLTCEVDVNLQYTLIASQTENITGTYQLTALIREEVSGWQRKVALQEETPFSGTTFGTAAKLDLCKMESLVKSLEEETSFSSGSYILSVVPKIKLSGSLQGKPLDATFNSGIAFVYDRVHFYLVEQDDVESPLSITEAGLIRSERSEVNTVTFLGTEIAVPVLRWLAVIGLLVSLAGFVILGLRLQTLANRDQAQFFNVRYEALLVDVEHVDLANSTTIEVTSMNALAKLAERFNTMILHRKESRSHEYYVQSNGATYRFVLAASKTGPTVPEQEPPDSGGEA